MKQLYIIPKCKLIQFRFEGMCIISMHQRPMDPLYPTSNCNCGCGPDCCSHRSDCRGSGKGGCNHKTQIFDLDLEI